MGGLTAAALASSFTPADVAPSSYYLVEGGGCPVKERLSNLQECTTAAQLTLPGHRVWASHRADLPLGCSVPANCSGSCAARFNRDGVSFSDGRFSNLCRQLPPTGISTSSTTSSSSSSAAFSSSSHQTPALARQHWVAAFRPAPRIFLLSSFSHDDADQWPLIPHFISHYKERLGLQPEFFLLILHSDNRNTTGISGMAQWLWQRFGIAHTIPVTEPYSSAGHMRVKHEILQEYVSVHDWVMQVDADEFVFFPRDESAKDVLARLDAEGKNVHFGLMVDRVATTGNIDVPPRGSDFLFAQFPLNCAVTLLLQGSDVRKATAYRGYLRTSTGNHNVFGLNASANSRAKHEPKLFETLLADIRWHFGPRVAQLLPRFGQKPLSPVHPSDDFASVYHFKWVQGLAAKLERRMHTETYTEGQYSGVRELLWHGRRFPPDMLRRFCNTRDLPSTASEPPRALTAWELVMLFLNIKPAQLQEMLLDVPLPERESFVAELLQRHMQYGVAREGFGFVL